MTSMDFDEALAASTEDAMSMDMSFLTAFRVGGGAGVAQLREREAQSAREAADRDEVQSEDDSIGDADLDDLAAQEQQSLEAGQRGGGGSGGNNAAPTGPAADQGAPEGDDVLTSASPLEETAELAEAIEQSALEEDGSGVPPVSLQFTDHQEDVQNAAAGLGGGSNTTTDAEPLPQSRLQVEGVAKQPFIRSLPDSLTNSLRELLRSAAVRELKVADRDAIEFSQRLGQGTLVTAFLMAMLDVRLEVDAATSRAAELFRTRDPLLGSTVAKMDSLAQAERETKLVLVRLRKDMSELQSAVGVVEQLQSYLVADGQENFLVGTHNLSDAPIAHKQAIFVRDRARAQTEQLRRREREAEGRPIR